MQNNRIFDITYHLLNHEHVTAKMLSEKFNVSVRTIYRDIDRMSQVGIPVYTERGKGGGISLLSDFVLSKVLLDVDERKSILQALQTTEAVKFDLANEETLPNYQHYLASKTTLGCRLILAPGTLPVRMILNS